MPSNRAGVGAGVSCTGEDPCGGRQPFRRPALASGVRAAPQDVAVPSGAAVWRPLPVAGAGATNVVACSYLGATLFGASPNRGILRVAPYLRAVERFLRM